MSKSSKPAQSGLGTVKRDWSSSSVVAPARSSQEIYWPPTPAATQPPAKKLTGSELRFKAIQDALAGYSAPTPSPPLVTSASQNKRVSPTGEPATAPPQKRPRRILPPDWPKQDDLSNPSLKPASSSNISPESSNSSGKKKIPSLFLSQEQTQILKLVQDGDSVFYTGSAGTGKSVLLREIIKTLRKKFSKVSDAVAITASTGI
ncbi:hypothetical protein GALMADRAFT_61611 [Galerina marginata CBS 339.88]|uniref:ATP-dependent DNA helicase n=1 Tax=Galerina marginata (strain CBS 339.88) TaxID=685588 RepID=A0A067TE89_GALM3|nr:hypothetical protein GALMADRAFT_61611 [Galerina marginata CBS 339.88]